MGKNLDQILIEARAIIGRRALVNVTIVTNQDDGIVSYARGSLAYHPSRDRGTPEYLSTSDSQPLEYFFSDRNLDITSLFPKYGGFPISHEPQPFSVTETDKLGVSISQGHRDPTSTVVEFIHTAVEFTLHSWENVKFSVTLESRGNLLIGVGSPVGNATEHALYVISFGDVFVPPYPPS